MRRATFALLCALAGLVLAVAMPAGAAKAKAAKAASCTDTCTATHGPKTLMGPVKSIGPGRTFVMAPKGGDVTVDAGKATVRDEGKKVSFSTLKVGTVVKAHGTLQSRKLTANDVCICTAAKKK